jgi:uncharacterized protein (DUF1697 family)
VTTMVALLRSVNVGGRNRVPMAELRTVAEALGFDGVETYLHSGNLVLTGTGPASVVTRTLEAGITSAFGLEVPVIVRSARQLSRILGANPFAAAGVDPKTLHVTFLAAAPAAKRAQDLTRAGADAESDGAFGNDRFARKGPDVFVHCPGGYGVTKLNNGFFERRAGVVATTRNWRTVTAIAQMAGLGVP